METQWWVNTIKCVCPTKTLTLYPSLGPQYAVYPFAVRTNATVKYFTVYTYERYNVDETLNCQSVCLPVHLSLCLLSDCLLALNATYIFLISASIYLLSIHPAIHLPI